MRKHPKTPFMELPELAQRHNFDVNELSGEIYNYLKSMAHNELRKFPTSNLRTTELLHETYVRVASADPKAFEDLVKMFQACLPRTITDHHRFATAAKRGGKVPHVPIGPDHPVLNANAVDLETVRVLESALDDLQEEAADLYEIFVWHSCWGLSQAEIATHLGLTDRTIRSKYKAAVGLLRSLVA